jgi:hypothetical protein
MPCRVLSAAVCILYIPAREAMPMHDLRSNCNPSLYGSFSGIWSQLEHSGLYNVCLFQYRFVTVSAHNARRKLGANRLPGCHPDYLVSHICSHRATPSLPYFRYPFCNLRTCWGFLSIIRHAYGDTHPSRCAAATLQFSIFLI